MNHTNRILIPAHVMARQVGDDLVILDLSKGSYFGLDPIGAQIWRLMSEGRTLEEICASVQETYDAAPKKIERDIFRLAETLRANELIEIR